MRKISFRFTGNRIEQKVNGRMFEPSLSKFLSVKKLLFFSIVLLSIGSCKKQEDGSDNKPLEIEIDMYIGLDNELSVEIFDYYSGQALFSETLVGENRKTEEGHPLGSQRILPLNLDPSTKMLKLSYQLRRNTSAQGWGGWLEIRKGRKIYVSEPVDVITRQTREIDLSKPKYN
ncbi:hypothetical protein GCM10011386_07740 [Parapedobacter defluvii]|uniref:Uncharacterized protein n=1 Tax=Parapedobacter defluvii TaxID=2045106 RepID=A0ABQ1L2Q9_9SPHI|nr:hypothetical protein [Parapedobacter defluvii]GGC18289.1 hypothetical protein GCM10011386_07740 [Parapedobacter defluvii]